jgi:thiamine-phosphate pyrophosphorylase
VSLPPALVALSPGDLREDATARFLATVEEALAAGLSGVLLRERELSDRAWLDLAGALRGLLQDGWLGGHDRVHLALAAGADACHLGFRSLAPAAVRARFGAALTIGLSTHVHDDPAVWSAADYLVHGPYRATPSKQGLVAPVGAEGLARAALAAGRPLWAIGGIGPADVRACRAAGARGVFVLRGVLGGDRPGAAAAAYLGALESARA